MNILELQNNSIQELLFDVGEDWEKVSLHYEYFMWKGSQFEKYVAKKFRKDGGYDQFDLGVESLDALMALNKAMIKDDESWTSCDIAIDSTGKYNFDFGYGMPELVKDMLQNAGEI